MMERFLYLAVYLVIFGIIIFLKKRLKSSEHYDEMQLQIRADAYKYAYGTTVVLLSGLILMVVIDSAAVPSYILSGVLLIILLAGVLVFGVYCIRHDSFFFIGQDWKRYFTLCIVVDAINLFTLVRNAIKLFTQNNETLMLQGLIANIIVEAGIVTFFTVICVMILSKMISNKKDAEV